MNIADPEYPYGIGEDDPPVMWKAVIVGCVPLIGLGITFGALAWAYEHRHENTYGGASQAWNDFRVTALAQLFWAIAFVVVFAL